MARKRNHGRIDLKTCQQYYETGIKRPTKKRFKDKDEDSFLEQELNIYQLLDAEEWDQFLMENGLLKKPLQAGLTREERLLTTSKTKVGKTLPVTPNCIIFNKSIMAKYPDIELDRATIFESLYDLMLFMGSEDACREHLEKMRWDGKPICPHCGFIDEGHYRLKNGGIFKGLYKCKDCRKRFTVTVGTIFEGSQVSLRKWFLAIYLLTAHKKGISSKQLGKDIKVTQKTAWFMLSRIRNSFANRKDFQFEDTIVQIDETYIGGKNPKKAKGKKVANTQGRSTKSKIPVFGMLSDGMVYTQIVENTSGRTLRPIIREKIASNSTLVTDGWQAYRRLSEEYRHIVIPHSRGMFKFGPYHTNSIEGFWSLLKRGIMGIYHATSPKHLHKYCDEFSFRYNSRHMSDGARFNMALVLTDERLTYKELIAD